MSVISAFLYLGSGGAGAVLGLLLLRLWRTKADRSALKPVAQSDHRYIVIDGSNVMYWLGDGPSLKPVQDVVRFLTSRGFTPGVVFDANAGHLLTGQYRHHDHFGRMLALPSERVMVVPKGTQADQFILSSARSLKAKVVTNDRYRDWADQHPEVHENGHLIQGGYRGGQLWLGL